MKSFRLILFLLSLPLLIRAQEPFPFFKHTDQLPADLLSKRTVVFMNVESLRWDQEAKIIHKAFIQTGVDAVAYYALSDILSGHDATNAFYRDISGRGIENLIIIHQSGSEHHMYATKLPSEGGFFAKGMEAFKMQGNDLQTLSAKFVSTVEQSPLKRNNFLIIDIPETFKKTNVIKTRRVENYNPDIRIDKLAVPKFKPQITNTIDTAQANKELDSIFSLHYPFQYGLVESDASDEEMIAQGYLMVLRRLENNGKSLKRMLGYKDSEETILVTVRKGPFAKVVMYPISANVHKYYVQQLYTKDIYLGNYWDADNTWQQALVNHLENLAFQLERK